MTYYIGGEINRGEILGAGNSRFLYSLRRNDVGELFFTKIDQLKDQDTIVINVPGTIADNYEDFEYGIDYFDGRLEEDHSRPYPNLYWDQYRWDDKNCYYYIDANGELVVRINRAYTYSLDQIV
jgi:hypothetical protein